MKKALQYTILIAFFIFSSVISLQAQPHPGEQNGGGPVSGERIGAEGAPIGDGVFILLTLALGYAGRRVYKMRTAEE